MFTDHVKLHLIAGKGGNGVVAWRREKYIPKGGPTGGNGGRGGSVIFRTCEGISSLEWFRHRHRLKAENGAQGGPNQMKGRDGKSLILKVPCGTLIKNAVTQEVLYDLTEPNQEVQICAGGRGGRGNSTFKTSTNRAPNICTPGKNGEELEVELELKLIADVGLVGFPNAGKSTLISKLADVKVKIAPYPFTTLSPNIGYLQRDDYTRLWIADIPGIIENAHSDRGLGLEFLRHIERTKLLVYVLDASGIDGRSPKEDYHVLREEIRKYNPEMLERPSIIVLNKVDDDDSKEHLKEFNEGYCVSALRGDGMAELTEALKNIKFK